jgi:hypothetical protein
MELSTPLNGDDGYRRLLQQISDTYTQGRVQAVQAVNARLIETYWQLGRHIVEFEQAGQVRAEYGKALIDRLAADLGLRHGKGFSRSNLIRLRQFYLAFPDLATKGATLSHQLTWPRIVDLLRIDDRWSGASTNSRQCTNAGRCASWPGKRTGRSSCAWRQSGQGRHPAPGQGRAELSIGTQDGIPMRLATRI